MTSFRRMGLAAALLTLVTTTFITTGCNAPTVHPNQFNEFDGATYDTLTLAHGALLSLRSPVAADLSRYTPQFNQAAKAYNQALTVYTLYRSTQSEAGVAGALSNLTLTMVLLETAMQEEMHVNKGASAHIRSRATVIRNRAAREHISVSDIMTELQIAAAIAQTVPASAPYAALAKIVLDSTTSALDAEQSCSGKLIDLQLIPAVSPLS